MRRSAFGLIAGAALAIGQPGNLKLAQDKDQCQQMCTVKQAQCLQEKKKTPNECGAEFSVCY